MRTSSRVMKPSELKSYLRLLRGLIHLHVEGNAHAGVQLAHEDLYDVTHELMLTDHCFSETVKQVEQAVVKDPRQVAVLYKCHFINPFFLV